MSKSRSAMAFRMACVLTVMATVAACGGGGQKKPAAQSAPPTTPVPSTESVAPSDTTAVTSSPTTAAATPPSTVARSTSATTARRGTATTAPKGVTVVKGGIANVTAAPSTAPSVNIQPGGTLTFVKASEIASMDPVKITNSGGSDGPAATMVYDTLVYSDTKTGTIVPQTAESLTSVDAVVWTLKLRPNIKFSDGTPYDAAAVKFNWARLQDPANAATRAGQANLVATMDVVDAVTLKITLKAKNAVFPTAVTLIPFIGSPAAIQQEGSSFGGAPVGAGPFVLKSWQRDSQQVFVRNPTYWRAPQPYLDQVIIKPIQEESQRINTFQAGQADASYVTAAQNADSLQKAKSGVEYTMILNGGINIYFNTTKPPFNELRARQAVALAIDFKDYATVVNGGLQEPIDSIFRHDSPFYDPAIVQQSNNPTQAQALFDQLAAEKGGPLTFTLTTFPAQNYSTTAQYVQGVLNKFRNVKVDVLVEANALHVSNCTGTNYPSACVFGSIFDDPEPTWTGLYTCDANPSPTGWCNTKFDADVSVNRSTLDPAQRISALKDAQRQFYAEVPSLYLERRYSWVFASPHVQDFRYANDGTPLFGEMWLKR